MSKVFADFSHDQFNPVKINEYSIEYVRKNCEKVLSWSRFTRMQAMISSAHLTGHLLFFIEISDLVACRILHDCKVFYPMSIHDLKRMYTLIMTRRKWESYLQKTRSALEHIVRALDQYSRNSISVAELEQVGNLYDQGEVVRNRNTTPHTYVIRIQKKLRTNLDKAEEQLKTIIKFLNNLPVPLEADSSFSWDLITHDEMFLPANIQRETIFMAKYGDRQRNQLLVPMSSQKPLNQRDKATQTTWTENQDPSQLVCGEVLFASPTTTTSPSSRPGSAFQLIASSLGRTHELSYTERSGTPDKVPLDKPQLRCLSPSMYFDNLSTTH